MLSNPDNALPLYVAIIILGLMLGKRWEGIRTAITTAGQKGKTKAATP